MAVAEFFLFFPTRLLVRRGVVLVTGCLLLLLRFLRFLRFLRPPGLPPGPTRRSTDTSLGVAVELLVAFVFTFVQWKVQSTKCESGKEGKGYTDGNQDSRGPCIKEGRLAATARGVISCCPSGKRRNIRRIDGDVVFGHFGELQLKGIQVECPLLFCRCVGK